MNRFIEITTLRFHLLFPFLAPVFICIRSWSLLLISNTSSSLAFEPNQHAFIMICFMFIGEILIGIFEIISIKRQRHEKTTNQADSEHERRTIMHFPIYEGLDRKHRDLSILYLFLMALLDYAITTGLFIMSAISSQKDLSLEHELKMMQIIFTSLLSYFFLKVSLYRHQYLSAGLILSGVIMIILSDSFDSLYFSSFYLIFFAFTSIQEVTEKWLMISKYISPFQLLCTEGCFGLSISIIGLFIVSFIPCASSWQFCKGINTHMTIESFTEGFSDLFKDKMNILYVFMYIISTTGLNTCTTLTSKFFTATHRTISDTLSSFIWSIIDIVWISHSDIYLPLSIPAYVIIFLGCLLYNEVIILKCCQMNVDTVDQICKRSIVDKNDTLNYDDVINPEGVID